MIHDISVVIPVKSEEDLEYLKPLLEELCRQTEKYRLDIVIMVRDSEYYDPLGLTIRKTMAMASRLKDRFEYVPPIYTQGIDSGGIVSARNEGVKSVQGDIIIHLDCDNILDNNYLVNQLVSPIVENEVMMTYSPFYYDKEQGKTEKERKLIKYNNFLLRFNFIPGIPFAVWKDIFEEIKLEEKNTMMKFSAKLLYKYPGGIKKIPEMTMVSPRHVLEKAKTHMPQKIKKKE